MKRHISKFKQFGLTHIKHTCHSFDIKKYTINEDGSIDVDGDVELCDKGLDEIPLDFNRVSGYFDCAGNKLTDLTGSPKSVGGVFDCAENELKSLKYGPISVGGDFYCEDNNLLGLTYLPKSLGGNIYANHNNLKNFIGIPEYFNNFLYIENNPVYSICKLFSDDSTNILGRNASSKITLFNEYDIIRGNQIILDRLNAFLGDIGKAEIDINDKDKTKELLKYYKII